MHSIAGMMTEKVHHDAIFIFIT